MSTLRQRKINAVLEKELGTVFREESRSFCLGAMVTVTQVNISPDMTYAKVFISIFGGSEPPEDVYKHIKEHGGYIRKIIGNRLAKTLRRIPEFDYRIDNSLDYANEIDELLKKK